MTLEEAKYAAKNKSQSKWHTPKTMLVIKLEDGTYDAVRYEKGQQRPPNVVMVYTIGRIFHGKGYEP